MPHDKTTPLICTPTPPLPTTPSPPLYLSPCSPSLSGPLVTPPHWSPTAHHHLSFTPPSGSRSLTTRTRSCGRVVKDAKRSEGEGPGTPQTARQSHKPSGGPVAQPAASTTPPKEPSARPAGIPGAALRGSSGHCAPGPPGDGPVRASFARLPLAAASA